MRAIARTTAAPVVSSPPEYRDLLADALLDRQARLGAALAALAARAGLLADVAARLVMALRAGGKVLVVGNGGSAAEAQHFAAELVGRFRRERAAYRALALTADTALLTAVANDYGYAEAFARQVAAFGQCGDVLLAFSTSGESASVLRAAAVARERGLTVVGVTAAAPSRLAAAADLTVRVPVADTAAAQELHMVVTHLLCDLIERELIARPGAAGE